MKKTIFFALLGLLLGMSVYAERLQCRNGFSESDSVLASVELVDGDGTLLTRTGIYEIVAMVTANSVVQINVENLSRGTAATAYGPTPGEKGSAKQLAAALTETVGGDATRRITIICEVVE